MDRRRSVYRRRSLNLGTSSVIRSRSAERSQSSMGPRDRVFSFEIEKTSSHSGLMDSPSFEAMNGTDNQFFEVPESSKNLRPRAMSDPLDAADADGIEKEEIHDFGDPEDDVHAIPTLPRYPYLETNNKNCWSESRIQVFSVRGKDYLRDRKKVPSERYLLRAKGCDLFLSDNASGCDLSTLHGALGGKLRHEPSLIIRLTFPWGLLIQYYEVPSKFLPFMRNEKPSLKGLSPQEQTLAKWFMGDDKYRTDRLKLIPNVAEGPWIVRNLVAGTPTIIGNKLPIKYQYIPKEGSKQDFLECNLDVGNSTKAAQKIVSVCRRYMTSLTVDIGFTIEGKNEDELPEEMMGSIRIHHLDSVKAPTIH